MSDNARELARQAKDIYWDEDALTKLIITHDAALVADLKAPMECGHPRACLGAWETIPDDTQAILERRCTICAEQAELVERAMVDQTTERDTLAKLLSERWEEVLSLTERIKELEATKLERYTKEEVNQAVERAHAEAISISGEDLARLFHETYEKLAPDYSYETRKDSAVPWDKVPLKNQNLMVATAIEVLRHLKPDESAALDERDRRVRELVEKANQLADTQETTGFPNSAKMLRWFAEALDAALRGAGDEKQP